MVQSIEEALIDAFWLLAKAGAITTQIKLDDQSYKALEKALGCMVRYSNDGLKTNSIQFAARHGYVKIEREGD